MATMEILARLHEGDGTEQAADDIVAPLQVEVDHVALMEPDAWMLGARALQHGRAQLEPLELEGRGQSPGVIAGAAGDIQQRGRIG